MRNTTQAINTANTSVVETELSDEETRTILTPFAFKIDQNLFGLSLAKPYKRALALLIDLFLIALLSDAPGELLAVVIAITLYRLGGKNSIRQSASAQGKIKGQKRRALLRGIGVFIVFVLLLDILPTLFSYVDSDKSSSPTATTAMLDVKDEGNNDEYSEEGIKIHSVGSAIELTALTYVIKKITEDSLCTHYRCWSKLLQKFITKDLADDDLSFSTKNRKKLLKNAVAKTNLNRKEKAQLNEQLWAQYLAIKEDKVAAKKAKQAKQTHSSKDVTLTEQQQSNGYSIVAWAKGIINDLGLGFGWAAFYFTVLTALWDGQTIGKKLLAIKVLQLDGTPLTLWDSFGRYGGYGAGIATGLLGFAQIFWDANRQAIHDKISATVVIDIQKNKKASN